MRSQAEIEQRLDEALSRLTLEQRELLNRALLERIARQLMLETIAKATRR